MSFRVKLLLLFVGTVVAAVGIVAWGVTRSTRRAFEQMDQQRTDALVAQFQREFAQRGEEVVHRVQGIADAEATLRMDIDLARPQADPSLYVNDARGLAQAHLLDFVELTMDDGRIISSAQWPARFGYKNDWVTQEKNWNAQGAFLHREDLPNDVALALSAVRVVRVGEKNFYIIGGVQLDQKFLSSLVLPAGMRALLYRNLEPAFVPTALIDASGSVTNAERLAPVIESVRKAPAGTNSVIQTLQWTSDAESAESFHCLALHGRSGELLGVLLVGSARRDLIVLLQTIGWTAAIVAGVGVLLGILVSGWVAARVSRPIEQLAAAARQVAAGNWSAKAPVSSTDEVGQLAIAFNDMTRQLADQRGRLLAAERVAAWRELARRLAHELKNPLFPMQITLDNLQRAREQSAEQFDETFFESTTTLRAELANMNSIVGRFSDFAKMPAPELRALNLNEAVRSAVRLFEPQFNAVGRPPITPEFYLDENIPEIHADPDLLHRALQNLILNSIDAMPGGGTLTLRTSNGARSVRIEVSDTGVGLTPEECSRLFTPYYTSKLHGTGLGLAIVQSVVSDHGGRIAVESHPGAGTTFRIELPIEPHGQERS